jgi:predicted PurR-regulated permease PerM
MPALDPQYIRIIILGILAAASGFFLAGFIGYTFYALIHWYRKKANLEKIWGGLIGIGFNLLLFSISCSQVWPPVSELAGRLIAKLF